MINCGERFIQDKILNVITNLFSPALATICATKRPTRMKYRKPTKSIVQKNHHLTLHQIDRHLNWIQRKIRYVLTILVIMILRIEYAKANNILRNWRLWMSLCPLSIQKLENEKLSYFNIFIILSINLS